MLNFINYRTSADAIATTATIAPMSTSTNIATQNTVEKAVTKAVIAPIISVDSNLKRF